MSPIAAGDLLLTQRGSTRHKVEAEALKTVPLVGDLFLVQRGTTQYKATYAQLPSLLDDDLILVQRGATRYKATGAEVKAWLGGTVTPPAGGPWTPADLTESPLFAFDASQPSTIVLNGSNVQEWKPVDPRALSTGKLIQQGGASQPIYNPAAFGGNGGVMGSATARWMQTALDQTVKATKIGTIFIVILIPIGAGNIFDVAFYQTAGTVGLTERRVTYFTGVSPYIGNLDANNRAVSAAITTTPPVEITSIWGLPADGNLANTIWRRNGAATSYSIAGSDWWGIPGGPDAAFCIGHDNYRASTGDTTQYASKNWGLNKVYIFTEVLSSADMERMEGWCMHNMGNSSLLPASHPYKSAPPTKPAP